MNNEVFKIINTRMSVMLPFRIGDIVKINTHNFNRYGVVKGYSIHEDDGVEMVIQSIDEKESKLICVSNEDIQSVSLSSCNEQIPKYEYLVNKEKFISDCDKANVHIQPIGLVDIAKHILCKEVEEPSWDDITETIKGCQDVYDIDLTSCYDVKYITMEPHPNLDSNISRQFLSTLKKLCDYNVEGNGK